tara:strand:- start:1725 stop:2282 length:558 start_codon:yes stop_codon:yes gene_type:complete
MNLRKIIKEEVAKILMEKLPKNKWMKATDQDLKDYEDDIVAMIDQTYKAAGGAGMMVKSTADIKKLAPDWELEDVDEDPDADVAIGTKKKPAGTKFVAGASDGSGKAKKELINKLVTMLKKSGNYAELSGAPEHVVSKTGLKYIDDEEVVRKALKKDITWKGDGWYERAIKGVKRTKRLYGKPKG